MPLFALHNLTVTSSGMLMMWQASHLHPQAYCVSEYLEKTKPIRNSSVIAEERLPSMLGALALLPAKHGASTW